MNIQDHWIYHNRKYVFSFSVSTDFD